MSPGGWVPASWRRSSSETIRRSPTRRRCDRARCRLRDVGALGREREVAGTTTRTAGTDGTTLQFEHVATHGDRGSSGRCASTSWGPSSSGGGPRDRLQLSIRLHPRGSWSASLRVAAQEDGDWVDPTGSDGKRRSRQRVAWRRTRPTLAAAERLRQPFDRAADDLFALRNWESERRLLGSSDGARWILNAGVPMFTGLLRARRR